MTATPPEGTGSSCGGVAVRVMLPLDTIDRAGALRDPARLRRWMSSARGCGVSGVSLDVWWGACERSPARYTFGAVLDVCAAAAAEGLEVAAIMSFHACGGNVGDGDIDVPIPDWVRAAPGAPLYTDAWGSADAECLSLSADGLAAWGGRTAVDMYRDFMSAFRDALDRKGFLGTVVKEVHVGLGPCGELRYPSYRGRWQYPGIGSFQCYDPLMVAAAKKAGVVLPSPAELEGFDGTSSSSYSAAPEETAFFGTRRWGTPEAHEFLRWYTDCLVDHGRRVLSAAKWVFKDRSVSLSAKLSGIHWLYDTPMHAAELTAGYYNTDKENGYVPFLRMFKELGVRCVLTCFEKTASLENHAVPGSHSNPDKLLRAVREAADKVKMDSFDAENALECYDWPAFSRIVANSKLYRIESFTFLRLTPLLVAETPSGAWPFFCCGVAAAVGSIAGASYGEDSVWAGLGASSIGLLCATAYKLWERTRTRRTFTSFLKKSPLCLCRSS
eukprot:m51a1_g11870 putative beta-amylase family protein (499) ;mRNA; r:537549-540962